MNVRNLNILPFGIFRHVTNIWYLWIGPLIITNEEILIASQYKSAVSQLCHGLKAVILQKCVDEKMFGEWLFVCQNYCMSWALVDWYSILVRIIHQFVGTWFCHEVCLYLYHCYKKYINIIDSLLWIIKRNPVQFVCVYDGQYQCLVGQEGHLCPNIKGDSNYRVYLTLILLFVSWLGAISFSCNIVFFFFQTMVHESGLKSENPESTKIECWEG